MRDPAPRRTLVVGDVQGCHADLLTLLEKAGFDPAHDQLWLTGDLVNRGPQSLAVLRYVKQLGKAARIVLGNHDLHLMACRMVPTAKPRKRDTLDAVLRAPDCDELIDWLRQQPLLHHSPELKLTMVHAGLPPQWRVEEAIGHAAEIELLLRNTSCTAFLASMYGDQPRRWDEGLRGTDRSRYIVNCLTRMRYVTRDGELDLKAKGAPERQPSSLVPWFAAPQRRSQQQRVVFGHWSTLALSRSEEIMHNVVALDTGAVWGGTLTCWCVETDERVAVQGSTPVALDD